MMLFRNVFPLRLGHFAGVRALQTQVAMQVARPARILELDALRGLAALAVVLFHYTTRYEELFGHSQPLAASLPWGHFGVDLFFMLSGFVILMTLERTRDAWSFAWGRFSRLYPAYWAAAAVTLAVVWLAGLPGQEVSTRDAVLNITMVQALLGAAHIDGAYWSLQAELIFYANMLVLFRCGAFRRPTLTVALWLALAATVQLGQPVAESLSPWGGELFSKLTTIASLKYIPLFAVGIVFYGAHKRGRLTSIDCAALVAVGISVVWFAGAGAAAVDLTLAGVLWLAILGRAPVLTMQPLVALGGLSYTLYLVHQNVGYVVIRELQSWGVAPFAAIVAALVVAWGLASWLHRAVELPAMGWLRGRNPAQRRQRLAAACEA